MKSKAKANATLIPHKLNFINAERQLDEFKNWLVAHNEFDERSVVNELKSRTDLCLLIQLAAGKGHPDCYKHQFTLQGIFRADLVIGATKERHFVLVEFEAGEKSSIFNQKKGTAQIRDWGAPLQHAFSQVSDWSWAKNDSQKSIIFQNAFGMPLTSETYLIVCGRSEFLNEVDKSRLHWRSEKTTIAASPIRFWTYDDLYQNCSDSMSAYRVVRDEARAATAAPPS